MKNSLIRKPNKREYTQEIAIKGAAASGTPFVNFFDMEEIIKNADLIGLRDAQIVSTKEIVEKYFKNRINQ